MNLPCNTSETKGAKDGRERFDCFSFSGHLYIKLEALIVVSSVGQGLDGATKLIGGYNAVRLDIGRPGSFQGSTNVSPRDVIVVRRR